MRACRKDSLVQVTEVVRESSCVVSFPPIEVFQQMTEPSLRRESSKVSILRARVRLIQSQERSWKVGSSVRNSSGLAIHTEKINVAFRGHLRVFEVFRSTMYGLFGERLSGVLLKT